MLKKFLILLLAAFFILQNHSVFAQTAGESLFDLSKPILVQNITAYQHNVAEPIVISPFTTVIIQPKSFSVPVTMYVYQGVWSSIIKTLPQGQSPINYYYFVFKDSGGKTISPSTPITIQTVNNYTGTNSYFYPVGDPGIDQSAVVKKLGNVTMLINLPVNDRGFISAVNKIIDPEDSSLHPTWVSPAPSTTPVKESAGPLFPSVLLPYILALAVIIVAMILVFIYKRRNKIK